MEYDIFFCLFFFCVVLDMDKLELIYGLHDTHTMSQNKLYGKFYWFPLHIDTNIKWAWTRGSKYLFFVYVPTVIVL